MRALAIALLVAGVPAHGEAPPGADPSREATPETRPAFRTYTDRDGLPQNVVNAIAIDSRGYLWVGTQSGAAYYNGHRWVSVDLPQKAVSNLVNQNGVLAASDGSVWFGTRDGGVSRLRDGQWTTFDTRSGLASNNVNCILEGQAKGASKERPLWFGTWGGGLSRLEDGRWSTFTTRDGLASNRILCLLESVAAGEPTLWIGTDGGGLARFAQGKWTTFGAREGLPDNKVWSLLESKDSEGRPLLWVGTERGGLAAFQEGRRVALYQAGSGLPSDSVYSLAETVGADGTRTLWAGTLGGGLARLRAGRWTVFDADVGLPNDLVRSLLAPPSSLGRETLWVGTDGGGLARLDEVQWTPFPIQRQLMKNKVTAVLETARDGTLWVATFGDGLLRRRGSEWKVVGQKDGLPSGKVRCLLETTGEGGRRTLWVGTNDGLARSEGQAWKIDNRASGLAGDVVFALVETHEDGGRRTLWVGTDAGLSRLEDGKWKSFTTESGLAHNSVRSLLETKDASGHSVLWVGTVGGLSRFAGGRWTSFDTRAGLPNNYVRSLLQTTGAAGARKLWVGTDGGVVTLDLGSEENPVFKNPLAEAAALRSPVVMSMAEDRNGRVYLFTLKGIVRVAPEEIGSVHRFTTEDGLPSNECSAGSTFVDERGRLWAGTTLGIAVLDPSRDVADRLPKPLHVERVLVKGREHPELTGSLSPARSARLGHEQNHLVFEYALLSFFRETETAYRTELVGFDEAPSSWTSRHEKEYSNLASGPYVFRVWGRDYAGNVSGPVEVFFRVRPAPWRSWWAYLVYAAAAIVAGHAGIRLRTAVLRRRNQELEARVAERTAEVMARDQELEAANRRLESANAELTKLNQVKSEFLNIAAHDLKNPLSIVATSAELITLVSQERNDITDLARNIHQSSDRMLNLVKSILDAAAGDVSQLDLAREPTSLPALAREVSEDFSMQAAAKDMVLELEVGAEGECVADVDPAKMRDVLENLISNAVKYSKRGATIRVQVEGVESTVRISVRDQGPGLTEEDKKKLFGRFQRLSARPTGGEPATGLGLAIVKQLVDLHGGRVRVESEPGQGATFIVEVPRLLPAS
jgi:signal transduction histidine kinase/ligand-binding sensor domain-containing protein